MIGWLWRILVGRFTSCRHKWQQCGTVSSYLHHDPRTGEKLDPPLRLKHYPVLQCEHCGEIKSVRV